MSDNDNSGEQAQPVQPVEDDPHKRSGVAHGAQTTEIDGNTYCNICGRKC